jgi:NADH dehydrogenase/NADH:ubiquinone oxidoreductase subunit G
VWINTHGSKLASSANFIVPTITFFEQEGIFLNLEQRPQKTLKTLNSFFEGRTVKNIFHSAYNIDLGKSFASLNHIYELVKFPQKFSSINNLFSKDILNRDYIKIQSYPLKSNLEDFYCSNQFTKNSIIMQKCSQKVRKKETNFIS